MGHAPYELKASNAEADLHLAVLTVPFFLQLLRVALERQLSLNNILPILCGCLQ